MDNVDFWPEIYLILYPSSGNSTTHITIQSTPELPETEVGSKIEVVANNSEIEIETKENRTSSDQEFEGSMSSSRTTEESTNTLETKSCNVTLTDLDEADQIQYEDQIQDQEDQNQDLGLDYEQEQDQVWYLEIIENSYKLFYFILFKIMLTNDY